MSETFTELVFQMPTTVGKSISTIGVGSKMFLGLVVHEDPETDEPGEWAISHLPTGYRVPSDTLSLAEALNLAVSLAALTNWGKLQTPADALAFSKLHRDELRGLGFTVSK
ncbi:MAG: hypothetical protein GXY58_12245 [Planctomycetaceae bacterium]|nr:hypothetical protein [Planctomycetaceae bacterium]